jgi:hypothetical protein
MTEPDRWRDVERIFEAVVGHPDHERSALLDARCGGDGELRRQVEALLRADRAAGRFLESTIALAAALTADLRRKSLTGGGSSREEVPPGNPGAGSSGGEEGTP